MVVHLQPRSVLEYKRGESPVDLAYDEALPSEDGRRIRLAVVPASGIERQTRLAVRNLQVYYGAFHAVRNVTLNLPARSITAIIGPSGCGKSTVLRCFNRMNDLVPSARVEGQILMDDEDIVHTADVVRVRSRVGMVFQRPNPFPKSIFDNVAYGPRMHGTPTRELPAIVERSLQSAALWTEVKDKLNASALGLSGGQQQRLCIARCLALQPDVVLMDEPCSALDPIATQRIEELMVELKEQYTIVIVTHNMQQAARVSDITAVFMLGEDRAGELAEIGSTHQVFTDPRDPRTEQYVTGRVG